jgi:universal stress protein A
MAVGYQHILLAVDFSEHAEAIVNRASDLASRLGAELSIVHVVQFLPVMDSSFGTVMPMDVALTEQLVEAGKRQLAELADRLGIPEQRRWLEVGSPETEIIRVAKDQGVDLIVVGSHGRHGIAALLGSVASDVVHHAECDILTVHLPAE